MHSEVGFLVIHTKCIQKQNFVVTHTSRSELHSMHEIMWNQVKSHNHDVWLHILTCTPIYIIKMYS